MNKCQEALKWFETELEDGKCSDECPQCNANEVALEVLKKISDGCEYCNKPTNINGTYSFFKDFPNWCDDGKIKTCLRHSCGSWQLHSECVEIECGEEYAYASDNVDIKFCPMCGKELEIIE